ncbi:MAG TPA: PAS domain-containing protein, partial [Flavobacterium sp.]
MDANLSPSDKKLLLENEEQKRQIDQLQLENEVLRESQKKLKQEQLKLNQAQALANLGSLEIDSVTNQGVWSNEMLRIYGLTPEQREQSFESWLNYVHPEDICNVVEIIESAREAIQSCSFSHRIVRPNGEVRHVNAEAQFHVNEAGQPISLIGTAHDVTDLMVTIAALQASEDAFKESEFRFKKIVEIAQEGIWLTNEKNITMFVNQKLCEILEYSNDEMHGKDLYSF